ncbi:hypothetical protein HanRHA438_Chr12g0557041 [Helianthus annuus]|uniref:Uncharacterized protein n=1 Tax=Helianthus annuus TaxID=4232 RepID=A0A9K3HHE8_HELAN|nr:hypothetical protein HanXRQr2_Chr12g0545711 [Helianthus annuus]KAJ0489712.1 hypothetical protein HanHA300_Chr12g0447131 [Helianthus annuus]KAJ0505629.1 hypothetical protein HanHA89_Chr12g0472661 [Helianthus annuus]KAJ0675294.1 hypothetical protein HanLR1_Chr12g0449561 [Helianthus annuus]KAJ0678590.1 hypothetical protein HanOQP8_Chr12g0449631 [Helianthus annuus]
MFIQNSKNLCSHSKFKIVAPHPITFKIQICGSTYIRKIIQINHSGSTIKIQTRSPSLKLSRVGVCIQIQTPLNLIPLTEQ